MARVPGTTAARNRKARHNYAIEETFEAGIALEGSEVKSLRQGRASIAEAYAAEKDGELYLFNAHIPEYTPPAGSPTSPGAPASCLCTGARSTGWPAPSTARA